MNIYLSADDRGRIYRVETTESTVVSVEAVPADLEAIYYDFGTQSVEPRVEMPLTVTENVISGIPELCLAEVRDASDTLVGTISPATDPLTLTADDFGTYKVTVKSNLAPKWLPTTVDVEILSAAVPGEAQGDFGIFGDAEVSGN
jgi:hypothetical protein